MAKTKRQKAAQKGARTRARRRVKRSQAAKKAAQTRKRRTPTKRQTKRRSTGNNSGFSSSVVQGFGFAAGGVLLGIAVYLLFAPLEQDEEPQEAQVPTTVDTTGLSPEESAIVLATVSQWHGTSSSGCQCWECK